MTTARRKFTQEFRDELCREVIPTSKPIGEVADSCGVGHETLRNWLIKYRDANGGSETERTTAKCNVPDDPTGLIHYSDRGSNYVP